MLQNTCTPKIMCVYLYQQKQKRTTILKKTIMKTKQDLINWLNRIQRNGQGAYYYQNGAGISIASDWDEISALIETISSDEYLNDIEIVDKKRKHFRRYKY